MGDSNNKPANGQSMDWVAYFSNQDSSNNLCNEPLLLAEMLKDTDVISKILRKSRVDLNKIVIYDVNSKKNVQFFHWIAKSPTCKNKKTLAQIMIKIGAEIDVEDKN